MRDENTTDIKILEPNNELGSHDSRFKLVECIGGGATAVVWKALDLNEEKITGQAAYKALKILHPRLQDPEHIHLLKTEAIHASRLSHTHIVNVIRFTEGPDGNAFIVMEYLQGDSLHHVLKQHGKFTPQQVIAYLNPVAKALDYAHEQGVFHRDLKPANLFVCKNKQSKSIVKILDFGLAWQLRQSSSQLDIEQVKPSGTVEYMAPETFFSHRPRANQDIHAFACVIYEMLQGSPPFGIDIAMRRKLSDMPPKPDSLNDKAWKVLKRGFAYKPEDRPQTASELLSGIKQAQFPTRKEPVDWFFPILAALLAFLTVIAYLYWKDKGNHDSSQVNTDTALKKKITLLQTTVQELEQKQQHGEEKIKEYEAKSKQQTEGLSAKIDKAAEAKLKQKVTEFQAGQEKSKAEIARLQQQLKERETVLQQEKDKQAANQQQVQKLERELADKQAKKQAASSRLAYEPKMILIPAGSFSMGCISNDQSCSDDEKPVHIVKINVFSLAQTEITFDQWQACVDGGGCQSNPTPDDIGWGKGSRPVINVSWNDTQEYIQWLNNKTGKHYRLPTESEWEYAARAGTKTKYSWGNQAPACDKQASNGAKFYDNKSCDNVGTEKVASYQKNAFGLYDMHGNVYEWVQDRWHGNYKDAPTDGTAWNSGDSSNRVIRGGSWRDLPRNLRSANRNWDSPDDRINYLGFRLASGQE